MLAAAAKGKTAAFDKNAYGCWGGGVGLGFGNQYLNFPAGIDCFYYFLSTGNNSWEKGREMAKKIEPFTGKDFAEKFLEGEGYMKSPELIKQFIDNMPIMDVPKKYVIFKPLTDIVPEKEEPQVIVFIADPDQLSALTVLAKYGRPGNDNVIVPFAAGCQQIGIFAYREARSESPRAVLGLTDLSARNNLKKLLDRNVFSFTVPWRTFKEMEDNVEGGFLQRKTWASLREIGTSPTTIHSKISN